MEVIGLKAPGTYYVSTRSYHFSFFQWERPNTFISSISGLSVVSPSPNANIICLWRPQDILKMQELPNRYAKTVFLWISTIEFNILFFGKDAHLQIPTIRLIYLLTPLDMGSVFREKHEIEIL